MPIRSLPLATGQIYHVANLGINRQPIFEDTRDHQRFLDCLSYYRFQHPSLPRFSHFIRLSKDNKQQLTQKVQNQADCCPVSLFSLILLPNRFHLILQQTVDGGITNFLTKLQNSYARFHNAKHQRTGPLFTGAFKAVRLENTQQLLLLSRHLHLLPLTSYLIKEALLETYQWSSLPDYLKANSDLLDLEPILSQFSTPELFRTFTLDQPDHQKSLPQIQHLLLES